MFSKSPGLVRNSLQIQINKQQKEEEDKYYLSSRSSPSSILSKENNPSFRFYNNYDGAVPFLWESRPGTPKCSFNETTLLPPLTPPPSYYYFNSNKKPSSSSSSSSRSRSSKLLHVLFPKMMNLKKSNSSVSSSSSSSSFSSSSSSNLSTVVPVSTSPKKYYLHRLRGGRRGLSFDSRVDYDHDQEEDIIGSSPTSTLCFFSIGKGSTSSRSSSSGGLLGGR
ncbi:hypothetical protein EZV62_016772 [Acer yangbiense]|uniref:Uncharacterized protein n=1 Tax=Acer yangbiense TaxID=1000413 RepID=A0A5C7HPE8_9ROSI|nr:hypothetical protein EZV62_016772 [Acer yangbiense]